MQVTTDLNVQYAAARTAAGLVRRDDRGLIEARGADRVAWLSNLTTNILKTLTPGDGNYLFATNIKGRVVFDANVLMIDAPDAKDGRLWIDIARGWCDESLRHMRKYMITEDVTLTDRADDVARLAVIGPEAAAIVDTLGFGNLIAMADLNHVAQAIDGGAVCMVRHDFAGVTGAEFIIDSRIAEAFERRIREAGTANGLTHIDAAALDVLRIEAGIPASMRDIDADVIPPETLQVERGISYHKGCYLGQEVIERMRSHGVLSKRLVGLRFECDAPPTPPLTLKIDGKDAGRVTSTAWSIELDAPVGLGYAKSAHAKTGTRLVGVNESGAEIAVEIIALPMRASS
jgi:folate-binding protein YgfZ